ncbi:hypothetical protein OC835_003409, partial [Tilletia horrida]
VGVLSSISRRTNKALPQWNPAGPGWDTDFPPSVETVQNAAQDHFDNLFHP